MGTDRSALVSIDLVQRKGRLDEGRGALLPASWTWRWGKWSYPVMKIVNGPYSPPPLS